MRVKVCHIPISVVILILWLYACSDQTTAIIPDPLILSPLEEALYFSGESVKLHAEIAYYPGYSHMEVFLDAIFIMETDRQWIDTLIPGHELTLGPHTCSILAVDNADGSNISEVKFNVEQSLIESEDMESFEREQVSGWSLDGWSIANSSADEDQHCLRSSADYAVALTRKTFLEDGSLSFYVKKGKGKLEFWMDGELKCRWFEKDDWGSYGFSVPAGTHVFRWTCDSEDTYIDKVEFTPGLEQHSLGEVYGGGTIFYLDSTGLHGLIAAGQDGKYEGNFEIPWGCYGLNITSGNRALSSWDGVGNTWAIVQDCRLEKIAARYCIDLETTHGNSVQDDWYLPAILELNILYKNRALLDGLGGQYYWSSTSPSNSVARVQNFEDGSHHGAHRNIPNISGPSTAAIHVRPVRKF